ncbi:MAG: MBL fold metallo-hydrolase [Planctomycetota bacterium]
MILRALAVGPLQATCYLVGCSRTRDAVVVDPGGNSADILEALRAEGLTARWIVATHGHPDHTGAVRELQDATGARFAIHAEDRLWVDRLREASLRMGIPVSGVPTVDRELSDGDGIETGDLRLRVLHTPGHTAGCVCLLVEAPRKDDSSGPIVLTGDTLFAGSIGRTDLPGGDGRKILESIHKRLLVLPDGARVLPGHGPETTIGEERRTNFFLSLAPARGRTETD